MIGRATFGARSDARSFRISVVIELGMTPETFLMLAMTPNLMFQKKESSQNAATEK